MSASNPLGQDRAQFVGWMHLSEKQSYTFELIQPLKASVQDHNDKGAYLVMCAEVIEGKGFDLPNGELIILSLPVKTMERAWFSKPRLFRNQVSIEDNVLFSFYKASRQGMTKITMERLVPKPEHIEFAAKNYHPNKVKQAVKEVEEI